MKKLLVNGEYEIMAPDVIAEWDAPTHWERARFASMGKHLTQGDILFDVGVEHGWQSAVFAKFFTNKMVLFEPSVFFWRNIKATWIANELPLPLAHFVGLVGKNSDEEVAIERNWTNHASGGEQTERLMPYEYLHEHQTQRVSLDDFVHATDIIPTAVTIDTEGSEGLVLEGAKNTLKKYKPKVWVSLHPDLMRKDYKTDPYTIHRFMDELGYRHEHLGIDHESHELYI